MRPMMVREKIHPTLLEMWAVMALWGILQQILVLLVTKRRLYYSLGSWAGVLTAFLCSGLMLRSITRVLDIEEEKAATAYAHRQYILRAVLVLAVFFGLAISHLGSVAAAFIGLFSLKAAAYLQPLVHRLPVAGSFVAKTADPDVQKEDVLKEEELKKSDKGGA